jgi:hypothetical protein
MKICISPDSLNLFGNYIARSLPGILTKDKTADALLKEMFSKAFSDFNKGDLSEERLREVVLQHMSLVPEIALSYLAKNPTLKSKQLVSDLSDLSAVVLDASSANNPKAFQKAIDTIAGIISPVNAPALPLATDKRFDAISLVFEKTTNQEVFWNDLTGYEENLVDPKRKFEFDVLRNIIQQTYNQNPKYSTLKYKMVRLKDIASKSNVVNTVLNADENYAVFVLVDQAGNIVEFDEDANIVESGQIPIFTFKQDRLEFDYQVRLKTEKLLKNKNIAEDEAAAIINAELDNHLTLINEGKQKIEAGKDAFFDLDISNSNLGFVETNPNRQVPLSEITNLDKCVVEIRFNGAIPVPEITGQYSNKSLQLFQKPLSSLTDQQFEMLFNLITNKGLKLSTQQEDGSLRSWKKIPETTRRELIRSFVDSYSESPYFYYNYDEKTVRLSGKVIKVEDLTLEDLKAFANMRNDIEVSASEAINPVNSKEQVTAFGQIYKGDDGKFYKAQGPRRSFSIDTKDKNFRGDMYVGVSIANGELVVKKIDRLSHVRDVSLTNGVLNSNGELRGNGAYIAFKRTQQNLLDDVEFSVPEVVFRSLSDVNKENKKPSAKKEEAAVVWYDNSPLKKVVDLYFNDEHHEYGPNFVANFVGNAINLYLGSNKTDIYHESFHAFFRGVLTQSERNEIFSALRKAPGYFKTVVAGKASVVSFEEATDLELEEYLAEEFREFATKKNKYSNKYSDKIKRAFEKIMNVLKSIFGNMNYADAVALNKINGTINAVFDNLYNGKFDVNNFATSTNEAVWSSSEFVPSKKNDKTSFTLEEMHTAMDSMQSLLSDFITYGLNIDSDKAVQGKSIQMLLTMALEPLDSPRHKELSELYDKIVKNSTPSGNGVFAFSENPFIVGYALDFIKKRFTQQLATYTDKKDALSIKHKALLTKILDNFGDFDAKTITSYLETKQVDNLTSIFLNNYSGIDFSEISDDFAFEDNYADSNVYIPDYKVKGNENTIDELMDKQTKQLLSSIHAYSEQGVGSLIVTPLGFKKLRAFKNMVAKTAKLLKNTHDAQEMCKKLKKAAETDKEFDQIFRRLGDITQDRNTTNEEDRQWTNFWQSFNKADVLLREFIIEKTINTETEEVVITSRSGQSNSRSKDVSRSWASNFNNLLTRSNFSVEETEGVNKGKRYLDVQKIYEAYNKVNERGFALISGTGPEVIAAKNSPLKIAGDIYTSLALPKAQTEMFKFLSEFGIDLVKTPEVRKALLQGDETTSAAIVSYINSALANRLNAVGNTDRTKLFKFDDLFKGFNYKSDEIINGKNRVIAQPDLFGYLKQLRELHYINSNDYTNFSAYTAYGELQSEKTLNSSLTMMVTEINQAQSYEELIGRPGMEMFNYELNPFALSSYWLRDMFNLYKGHKFFGKRNADFNIGVENLSGNKIIEGSNDKGIATIDSDELSKFVSDFHLTLEGRQEILRSADKSTSLTAFATRNKGNGDIRKGADLLINKADVESIFDSKYKGTILYNEFEGALEAELSRVTMFRQLKKDILAKEAYTQDLFFDAEYLERGTEFYIFDDIFTDKLKNELVKANIDGPFQLKEYLETSNKEIKTKIEKELVEYFRKKADLLYIEKNNELIIADDKLALYQNENEEVEETRLKMFRTFTINNFLQNVNYASLFLGDPAVHDVESEGYHKRIAGLISTGKIFRHDASWLKKLNSAKYNAYGFSKKSSTTRKDFSYTGYLNTAVIKDTQIDSELVNHYANILGINASDYSKMKEADGQGWISFDAYRLLNDSLGEWSSTQEALYQKMLRGETLNAEDVKTTFPVRKFQYYGDVRNNDSEVSIPFAMSAFHKYSLMPLIPALIEGTKLEVLHKKMMNEGIDYATMHSGSKLSSISKLAVGKNKEGQDIIVSKLDEFYKNDRTVDTTAPFVKNQIHVKYLKSQTYIAEGFKGKITLPTQMRKMILLDLMSDGKPLDYKGTEESWNKLLDAYNNATGAVSKSKARAALSKASIKYDWYLRYEDALTNLEDYLKDELLADIDMKPVKQANGKIEYKGDSTKLVEYLKKQLTAKEILPEEIDFILNPDGSGKLRDDLSFSLISEKIEEILVTLVDKKLRSLKVNGEALIQVSSAMFEKTFGEKVQNSSNELKFYYLKDSEGNILTDSKGNATFELMEVKIALQGDYKKLLHTTHADGKKIMVRDEEGNVDYTASLNRLNETIKNNAGWLEKNKELLKLPGVRIPTQGRNALDAAQIVEFLPEFVGPYIIMPTEIVAKNGSDFDIDKAFFMMKNLLRSGKTVEEIKHFPVSESVEDLSARLDDLYKLKKEVGDELTAEWNKQKDFINSNRELSSITKNAFAEINDITSEIEELKEKRKALKQVKKLDITQLQEINSQISELYFQKSTLHDFVYEETVKLLGVITTLKDKNLIIADTLKKYNLLKERNASIDDSLYAVTVKLNAKGVKGLENELTNLFIERLSMSNLSDVKSLLVANTTDDVEPHARATGARIAKTYNKHEKLNSNVKNGKIARSEIFSYRYNLLKQQENSVGMDGLGIAAVASTFYGLFTTFGAKLNTASEAEQKSFEKSLKIFSDPSSFNVEALKKALKNIESFDAYTIKMPHNSLGNAVSLGLQNNVDGKSISDLLSQLINGYVDVAKDSFIFDAQGTYQNTPALLLMVMAGVPMETIIDLSSNPLVLKYNQIRKQKSGVFASLDKTTKSSITTGAKINESSQKVLQAELAEYIEKPGMSFKLIDNLNTEPFTAKELNDLVTSPISYRQVEVLAHYIQIDKMASDLNEFTQLTKYDTTKIRTISEAQKRISDTETFISQNTAIPNQWFEYIKNTASGKFNNDQFLIDLFDQYFGVRDNPMLIKLSLTLRGKGIDPVKLRSDFKNDFLWFLYQNAVYNNNNYTIDVDGQPKTYNFIESKNPMQPVVVDNENNTITYGKNAFEVEVTSPRFMYAVNYFPLGTINQWVKFRAEYDALNEKYKDLSDEDFNDVFYMFDNPVSPYIDKGEAGRNILIIKAALYQSKNIAAMFDSSSGVVSMLRNFQDMHPELSSYSFFADMATDLSFNEGKNNIYFPQLKGDPKLAQVYRENIEELKNHPAPEVAKFFREFNHIAMMQTGYNSKSKYYLGNLIDQAYPERVIDNVIGLETIQNGLDDLSSDYKLRTKKNVSLSGNQNALAEMEINGQFIEQYLKLYNEMLTKEKFNLKVRGYDYTVPNLDLSRVDQTVNPNAFNNTMLIPLDYENTNDGILVFAEEFFESTTPAEYAESLRETGEKIMFFKQKLIAPTPKQQKELDAALLTLGVDNSKDTPRLIFIPKDAVEGRLSIAQIPTQNTKSFYRVKDNAMATASTKAIGVETKAINPLYNSSSKVYAKNIKENYPTALANSNTKFKTDDSVWVFGSTLAPNAYKGGSKTDYVDAIKNTFDTHHKPLLDKAIKAGVNSFNIGTASGIDQLATSYLVSLGFSKVPVYTSIGKYYNLTKTDKAKSPINYTELEIRDAVEDIRSTLNVWFDNLSEADLITNGKTIVDEKLKNAIKDRDAKSSNNYRARVLYQLGKLGEDTYISIGDSIFDSYVEQILNDYKEKISSSEKYGRKKVISRVNQNVNLISSASNEDVVTFDSIPGITRERKMEILSNFVQKHSEKFATEAEAIAHINNALANVEKREMVIDKLKTCY